MQELLTWLRDQYRNSENHAAKARPEDKLYWNTRSATFYDVITQIHSLKRKALNKRRKAHAT